MRKLTLNLDELQVESFETDAVRAARGTVEGNEEYTYYCGSVEFGCRTPGYASCDATRCKACSSEPTCEVSCNATCGFTACCA